jgi:hypothetical protein
VPTWRPRREVPRPGRRSRCSISAGRAGWPSSLPLPPHLPSRRSGAPRPGPPTNHLACRRSRFARRFGPPREGQALRFYHVPMCGQDLGPHRTPPHLRDVVVAGACLLAYLGVAVGLIEPAHPKQRLGSRRAATFSASPDINDWRRHDHRPRRRRCSPRSGSAGARPTLAPSPRSARRGRREGRRRHGRREARRPRGRSARRTLAMTGSPMNFSTVPPCRSTTARARSK